MVFDGEQSIGAPPPGNCISLWPSPLIFWPQNVISSSLSNCTEVVNLVKFPQMVFTALHRMQTWSIAMRILSVCPSIRLSNAWSPTKWKKDRSRFLHRTKDHLAWFSEKKNGWWGAAPSTWNIGSTDPRWSDIADFQPIFARSVSTVTPSQKRSINTNRKSTTRFPMSLRSSSCVALSPPKGQRGLKNAKRPISVKNRTSLEESQLESIYVKTVSGNVVRHSLA